MSSIPPGLIAALREQLERRREALARGATHVGWKLGMGDRERIGGHIAVGFLTSETVLAAREPFRAGDADDLRVDAEVVVELGWDVAPAADTAEVGRAIARYGGAVEIVDLAHVPGEPGALVASNVFHRGVAFGQLHPAPVAGLDVTLAVNGELRASGRSSTDLSERIAEAARLLASVGERLRAGDRVLTGLVVQEPAAPGDEVVATFGRLGTVRVAISA